MDKAVDSPAGLFARPNEASRILLPTHPVLESWNAADHPDQLRLRDYLDGLLELIDFYVLPPSDLLAFELVVGLPPKVAVDRGGRDLDNYLMPIARRIGAGRIAAAFGRKVVQSESTIAVGVARLRSAPSEQPDLRVHTTTSAQSSAWKRQINQACGGVVADALPPGPVAVCIRFGVSNRRNWSELWKPAIDALGPVLGMRDPRYPFRPDDDRIVDLELHRNIDESLGNDVIVDIWWRRLTT